MLAPLSAGVAAIGVAALLSPTVSAPAPSSGAPPTCRGAQRYAAESGTDLFRVNRLDPRPAGRRAGVTDTRLAQARSAMVAESTVNSAAAGRVVGTGSDAGSRSVGAGRGSGGAAALSGILQRQAPPSNTTAARRVFPAGDVGPLSVGAGTLSAHARWDPAMACGAVTGQVARAEATVDGADLLSGRAGGALVHVPRRIRSLSTTALERRGASVHAVARATVTAGRMDLIDGAVRVTVLRAPMLTASISADGGAEIRYVPAVVEVSGDGFDTWRLESAGDEVTVTLGDDRMSTEAAPAVPGNPLGRLLSGLPADALRAVPPVAPLTVPGLLPRPGVPQLDTPSGDAPAADGGTAEAVGPDDTLRISIGDVRQAMAGHAIAAGATAVHVEVVAGAATGPAPNGHARGGVVLDLDVGVLEAAAVAPELATGSGGGAATGVGGGVATGAGERVAGTRDRAAVGGTGGGLAVTGPRVDLVNAGGVSLITVGFAFLMFGLHRPRRR